MSANYPMGVTDKDVSDPVMVECPECEGKKVVFRVCDDPICDGHTDECFNCEGTGKVPR